MLLDDPSKNKALIQILKSDNGKRTPEQLQKVLNMVETFVRESEIEKKKGVKLLTKRAYIAHLRYKEGFSKKKAKVIVAAAKADPNVTKSKENNEVVYHVRKATSINNTQRLKSSQSFSGDTLVMSNDAAKCMLTGSMPELDAAAVRAFGVNSELADFDGDNRGGRAVQETGGIDGDDDSSDSSSKGSSDEEDSEDVRPKAKKSQREVGPAATPPQKPLKRAAAFEDLTKSSDQRKRRKSSLGDDVVQRSAPPVTPAFAQQSLTPQEFMRETKRFLDEITGTTKLGKEDLRAIRSMHELS